MTRNKILNKNSKAAIICCLSLILIVPSVSSMLETQNNIDTLTLNTNNKNLAGTGDITIHLNGGTDIAYAGQINTFEIWIANDEQIGGMSPALEINLGTISVDWVDELTQSSISPDTPGADGNPDVIDHNRALGVAMDGSCWTLGGLQVMQDLTGSGLDHILFGGASLPPFGLDAGPSELAYSLSFYLPPETPTMVDGLSVKPYFYPPAGSWVFTENTQGSPSYPPDFCGQTIDDMNNPVADPCYFDIEGNDPPIITNESPDDGSVDVPVSLTELSVTIEEPEGETFEWEISLPSVGGSGASGETNGTKICTISGLDYETTYTWTVSATDSGSGVTTEETYTFTTEDEPPKIPDLDGEGDLSWIDVEPSSTVTGTITIENVGDAESLLDWEIDIVPSWGTFSFDPEDGIDLTPEDGTLTIDVEVVAPADEDTQFSGEITIVNSDDNSDYIDIEVSLATPLVKNTQQTMFQQLFEKLIEHFPILKLVYSLLIA